MASESSIKLQQFEGNIKKIEIILLIFEKKVLHLKYVPSENITQKEMQNKKF